VTAFIISKHPRGIPRIIEAHQKILEALQRRDKAAGQLWVNRHLNDWKVGFELSGMNLDDPVDQIVKW
jgi:GntR family transcriptional repressor for pyruvate dehydrogenase complex